MSHCKLQSTAGHDASKDTVTVNRSDGVEGCRGSTLHLSTTSWQDGSNSNSVCAELSLYRLSKLETVALEVKDVHHTPGIKPLSRGYLSVVRRFSEAHTYSNTH